MNDHEAFLRAIFKQPEEMTVRLAFADWLDEHDHPGGELIRVRQQLSQDDLSKTKRTALVRRERKLIAACDQDWLVQLERADWKLRYLQLRPENENEYWWTKKRQVHWRPSSQAATTRVIADFEKQVGKPLPRSWKACALGCGSGHLLGGPYVGPPAKGREAWPREWFVWRTLSDAQLVENRLYPEVRAWIRDSVQFATGDNGDFIVWNTTEVTDPLGPEYEIVELAARGYSIMRTYDSFEAMWNDTIEWFRQDPDPSVSPFEPQ